MPSSSGAPGLVFSSNTEGRRSKSRERKKKRKQDIDVKHTTQDQTDKMKKK